MISMAMIFPGQGSHNIPVLQKLYKKYKIIKYTFEEASNYLNYNMWKFINTPNIFVKKNQYIQPLILITSVAIYRLWKKIGGIDPIITAGHSLGEYSALVCGKSLKFSDAVKLVEKRGIMMQQCVKNIKIKMQAIIGLKKKIVFKICKKNSKKKIVNIASINSTNQIIISGHEYAVKKTGKECKKKGAKYILNLPINIAAHCSIMKKMSHKLYKKIKKIPIQNPKYTIISSISNKKKFSKYTIKNSLIKQLYKPVQWHKTITYIKSKANLILELGMSNTLTNLQNSKQKNQFITINNLKNMNLAIKLLKQ